MKQQATGLKIRESERERDFWQCRSIFREREREREILESNMGPFPRKKKNKTTAGMTQAHLGASPKGAPKDGLDTTVRNTLTTPQETQVLTNCQVKGGKRGRRRRGVRGELPGPVPSASHTGGQTLSTQATSPTTATRTLV